MHVITRNMLKDLREEMRRPRISQKKLAELAGVSTPTVRNAEGRGVTWQFALSIVAALNTERHRQGLSHNHTVDSIGIPII